MVAFFSPALLPFVASSELSTMQLTSAAKYPVINSTTTDYWKIAKGVNEDHTHFDRR